MDTHKQQEFGELEDCYMAFIPKDANKSKKKQQIQETNEFYEMYQLTIEKIDILSRNIIDRKFFKLSNSLLQWIEDELTNLTFLIYSLKDQKQQHHVTVKFGFLQVDSASIDTVSQFYNSLLRNKNKNDKLNQDCVEYTLQNNVVIEHSIFFEQDVSMEKGFPNLLNYVLDICAHQYISSAQAHTTVFLLSKYLTSDELIDLKKTLLEEIKFRHPNTIANLLFILPLQQTTISSYEVTKLYSFSDPKKMLIDLLLQLISDPQIPLLSQELYTLWERDFNLYISSFQQELFKIKQAYYIMYQNLYNVQQLGKDRKYSVLKDLLQSMKNEPAKNQQYLSYIQKRKILSDAISVFSIYIQNLKKENQLHLQSFKFKLFGLLCANQQSHWFTLSHDCKLEKAMELFSSANYSIRDQIDEKIIQYLDDTKQPLQADSQNKKNNDRALQMLNQNLTVKQRFEKYVNQFLNLFIVQVIGDIKKNYSQYTFKDYDYYLNATSPDILYTLHRELLQHGQSNFKQTAENYKRILNQYQIALSNLVEKQDIIDFQAAVGNLRILGLVEDTKKIKPTIQRAVFAKQMFVNYSHEL